MVPITVSHATDAQLVPSPIVREWILEGAPQARVSTLARSGDGCMEIVTWTCTPGKFRWYYDNDEMVYIISGEVFIADQVGFERRLGPGDGAFFPAGTSNIWHVTQELRKVAVCRVAVPLPIALGLRLWRRLFRRRHISGWQRPSKANATTRRRSATPLTPTQ